MTNRSEIQAILNPVLELTQKKTFDNVKGESK